jgi:hypothetical protein
MDRSARDRPARDGEALREAACGRRSAARVRGRPSPDVRLDLCVPVARVVRAVGSRVAAGTDE